MGKLVAKLRQTFVRPQISVIVLLRDSDDPVRVERTIRSVLNQRMRDAEVLAVHPKGAIPVRERLENLAARDSRVRLVEGTSSSDHELFGIACRRSRGAMRSYLAPGYAFADMCLFDAVTGMMPARGGALLVSSPDPNVPAETVSENLVRSSLLGSFWSANLDEAFVPSGDGRYWDAEIHAMHIGRAEELLMLAVPLKRAGETAVPESPARRTPQGIAALFNSIRARGQILRAKAAGGDELLAAARRQWLLCELHEWIWHVPESPEGLVSQVREAIRELTGAFAPDEWMTLPFWDRSVCWALTHCAESLVDCLIEAARLNSHHVPWTLAPDSTIVLDDAALTVPEALPEWIRRAASPDLRLDLRVWSLDRDSPEQSLVVSALIPGLRTQDTPRLDFAAGCAGAMEPVELHPSDALRGIDAVHGDPLRSYTGSGHRLTSPELPEILEASCEIAGYRLEARTRIPARSQQEIVVDEFLVDEAGVRLRGRGEAKGLRMRLGASLNSYEIDVEESPGGWSACLPTSRPLRFGGYFLDWARGVGAVQWQPCGLSDAFLGAPVRLLGPFCGVELSAREHGRAAIVLSPPVPNAARSRFFMHDFVHRPAPKLERAVFFDAFNGKSIGDSPGALCVHLLADGLDAPAYFSVRDAWQHVPEGASPVIVGTREWVEALRGSRVIVSNNHFPPWFEKQSGQFWLQTWHGTPIKRLLRDAPREFIPLGYRRLMERQVPQWDLLLAQTPRAERDMRSSTGYEGAVHVGELPRNLRFLGGDALRSRTRSALGIAEGEFVVLYAPTWRDQDQSGASPDVLLDPSRIAEQTGVRVLARSHHMSGRSGRSEGVIEVSDFPHVEDLMLAADLLITDYSSIVFDFALTGKPILLHVPDLEWYRDVERGFYRKWPEDSPWLSVREDEELFARVRRFKSERRENAAIDPEPIIASAASICSAIITAINLEREV